MLIMTGAEVRGKQMVSVEIFKRRFSKFEHHWPTAIYIIFHGSIDEVHN